MPACSAVSGGVLLIPSHGPAPSCSVPAQVRALAEVHSSLRAKEVALGLPPKKHLLQRLNLAPEKWGDVEVGAGAAGPGRRWGGGCQAAAAGSRCWLLPFCPPSKPGYGPPVCAPPQSPGTCHAGTATHTACTACTAGSQPPDPEARRRSGHLHGMPRRLRLPPVRQAGARPPQASHRLPVPARAVDHDGDAAGAAGTAATAARAAACGPAAGPAQVDPAEALMAGRQTADGMAAVPACTDGSSRPVHRAQMQPALCGSVYSQPPCSGTGLSARLPDLVARVSALAGHTQAVQA